MSRLFCTLLVELCGWCAASQLQRRAAPSASWGEVHAAANFRARLRTSGRLSPDCEDGVEAERFAHQCVTEQLVPLLPRRLRVTLAEGRSYPVQTQTRRVDVDDVRTSPFGHHALPAISPAINLHARTLHSVILASAKIGQRCALSEGCFERILSFRAGGWSYRGRQRRGHCHDCGSAKEQVTGQSVRRCLLRATAR